MGGSKKLGTKAKKAHYSKNRKRNWGKTNIVDVENYIEEKVENEILGVNAEGKDILEKDTAAKSDTKKSLKNDLMNLKCHRNLRSYSKVAVPYKAFTAKQLKESNLIRVKEANEIKAQTQKKKLRKAKPAPSLPSNSNILDVWECAKLAPKPEEEMAEVDDYYNRAIKKKQPNVSAHHYQKPSLLCAIETPHSGSSYIPTYEDHQDLLFKANEVEEKKEKAEQLLKNKLKYCLIEDAPTEESKMKELMQGLESEEEEIEEEENKEGVVKAPIRPENRKTKQKRRRENEQKLFQTKAKLRKLKRKRENEVSNIQQYKKLLVKQEELSLEETKKREMKKAERMFTTHRLGSQKFVEKDIEVALTDELCSNLRTLKPEGNILEDRYSSMLKRNMFEPRSKQLRKRKYKRRSYVKKGHRMEEEEDKE